MKGRDDGPTLGGPLWRQLAEAQDVALAAEELARLDEHGDRFGGAQAQEERAGAAARATEPFKRPGTDGPPRARPRSIAGAGRLGGRRDRGRRTEPGRRRAGRPAPAVL